MAAERLSMRTIKEVLRLKWEKVFKQIDCSKLQHCCNIAGEYTVRAKKKQILIGPSVNTS